MALIVGVINLTLVLHFSQVNAFMVDLILPDLFRTFSVQTSVLALATGELHHGEL